MPCKFDLSPPRQLVITYMKTNKEITRKSPQNKKQKTSSRSKSKARRPTQDSPTTDPTRRSITTPMSKLHIEWGFHLKEFEYYRREGITTNMIARTVEALCFSRGISVFDYFSHAPK